MTQVCVQYAAEPPVGVCPGRLWSVLDIMREFGAVELVDLHKELVETREWCIRREALSMEEWSADHPSKQEWSEVLDLMHRTMRFAETTRFPMTFTLLNTALSSLDPDQVPSIAGVKAHVMHVINMLEADVSDASFLVVPPDLILFVDNGELLGETVAAAFPSASTDLRDAGNCLAADCNTAAVFHLMRAVEWGLRALAVHLGFRQMRIVKKSGLRKHVPISHLEWEKVLDQLQLKVDKRVEKMRPGKRKQSVQEFYYPALQEIRGIRDAWRNHTMHARSEYSHPDAMAILSHVRRLMTSLSTRVSDKSSSRANASRVRRFPSS